MHVAVDAANQVIVSARLSQCAADVGELVPTIEAATRHAGRKPKSVLADSGYRSEKNFRTLKRKNIEGFVSLGREGKQKALDASDKRETKRMEARLATKRGRRIYARRKTLVEPVFGWIKGVIRFRSFSLRGVRKVAAEWSLVCLAMNLRRMAGLMRA